MTQRGWLLFAAMCVIWGIPYLMIRVAVRELTPATLVFGRTALGALLLVPAAAWRHELAPAAAASGGRCSLYTVIEIGVPWLLLARAETKLTSSLTGLLIAGVPLVGAVIVRISGERERMGARRWLGLLVGTRWASPRSSGSTSAACRPCRSPRSARSQSVTRSGRSSSRVRWPTFRRSALSLLRSGSPPLAYAPVGIAEAPGSLPRLTRAVRRRPGCHLHRARRS